MRINTVSIFYWKKLCNFKSFDLNKKSHRLLTVLFWIILILSTSYLSFSTYSYFSEKDKYIKDKALIDEYEANFALNRFFEKLTIDVKNIENQLAGSNGLIYSCIEEEKIPEEYSLNDIKNLIRKLSNQVALRENIGYSYKGRELYLKLPKIFDDSRDNWEVAPNTNYVDNLICLINIAALFNGYCNSGKDFQDFGIQWRELDHTIFTLYKATLSLPSESETYHKNCCYKSAFTGESTKYFYIHNWNELSVENAFLISNALPYEFSIDYFDKLHKTENNLQFEDVQYFPSYLIDPFRELSFYDPRGFNPNDLKGNLVSAKLTIDSSLEYLLNKVLFSLLIILGTNSFLILFVRITNWINNG